MKKNLIAIFGLVFLVTFMSMQFAIALDFNQTLSSQDKQSFDQMLSPVLKIYNLVKYSASVLAVLVLLFAGVTYITAGSDPGKREKAKNMATYVIIGLVVIWAAPLIVNFIVG